MYNSTISILIYNTFQLLVVFKKKLIFSNEKQFLKITTINEITTSPRVG